MSKKNTNQAQFQENPYNAYDYYKRNYAASEDFLNATNFQSVQDMGANIGQRFMPNASAYPHNYSQNPNFPNYNPQNLQNSTKSHSFIDVKNPSFIKGALAGAVLGFIATNPTVQKTVVAGAVNLWATFQGSIEEVKEQIQDAKEELSQDKE